MSATPSIMCLILFSPIMLVGMLLDKHHYGYVGVGVALLNLLNLLCLVVGLIAGLVASSFLIGLGAYVVTVGLLSLISMIIRN